MSWACSVPTTMHYVSCCDYLNIEESLSAAIDQWEGAMTSALVGKHGREHGVEQQMTILMVYRVPLLFSISSGCNVLSAVHEVAMQPGHS